MANESGNMYTVDDIARQGGSLSTQARSDARPRERGGGGEAGRGGATGSGATCMLVAASRARAWARPRSSSALRAGSRSVGTSSTAFIAPPG